MWRYGSPWLYNPPAHPRLVFIVRCFVTVRFPNLLFDEQKQKNRKLFFFPVVMVTDLHCPKLFFWLLNENKRFVLKFLHFYRQKNLVFETFPETFCRRRNKEVKMWLIKFLTDGLRHRIDPRMKKQNRACSCRMFLCSYLINNDWFQPFPGFFPPLWPKRIMQWTHRERGPSGHRALSSAPTSSVQNHLDV